MRWNRVILILFSLVLIPIETVVRIMLNPHRRAYWRSEYSWAMLNLRAHLRAEMQAPTVLKAAGYPLTSRNLTMMVDYLSSRSRESVDWENFPGTLETKERTE